MSKKGGKDKTSESTSYTIGDVVLAKIRGFPPWPAQVVDHESAPANVLKERPTSSKTKFYCVQFFPAGDYSWSIAKDMSSLQKHEIEAYISEPHKKNGDLLEGYRIALDPEKWAKEKEAAKAAAEAEEAEAEVDQLEGEEEDGSTSEKKTKKRKRETEAKPKAKKTNGTTEKKKKSTASKKEPKSMEGVESEDDAGASSKPTKKKKKDDKKGADDDDNDPEVKKVREWRHALQRGFLNTKSPATEETMPENDKLFKEVETYNISIKQLQASKIGKVMRHIAALPSERVPKDEEYKFRDRANALVQKWQQLVSPEDESKMDVDGEVPSAVNGDANAKEE